LDKIRLLPIQILSISDEEVMEAAKIKAKTAARKAKKEALAKSEEKASEKPADKSTEAPSASSELKEQASKGKEKEKEQDTQKNKEKEADKPKESEKKAKLLAFTYELATGKLALLEDWREPAKRPRWASVSPDEKTVIFARGHNLYMMDAASFELAKKRPKKHVTSATKSNAIIHTMPFWDEIFRELSTEYSEIRTDQYHVDNLTTMFILHPEKFDEWAKGGKCPYQSGFTRSAYFQEQRELWSPGPAKSARELVLMLFKEKGIKYTEGI
jgi:flagellar biosynthesis GTPase FlhF